MANRLKTEAGHNLPFKPPLSIEYIRAAERGDGKKIKRAIKHATISIHSKEEHFDQGLLHLASFHGHLELVELLIIKGAYLEMRDKNEWTPLHCAASEGHLEICKLLLHHGAEADVVTHSGTTPMHYLAKLSFEHDKLGEAEWSKRASLHLEVMKLALEKVYFFKRENYINTHKVNGDTPLHEAALCGSEYAALFLIENKANVNVVNNNNESPLHYAARSGRQGLVELLLSRGGDPTLRGAGGTPAAVAATPDIHRILQAAAAARETAAALPGSTAALTT